MVIFLNYSYNLVSCVVYVCTTICQNKVLVCVKVTGNKVDSESSLVTLGLTAPLSEPLWLSR